MPSNLTLAKIVEHFFKPRWPDIHKHNPEHVAKHATTHAKKMAEEMSRSRIGKR
jgi:hypothetical protein